ncbi:MAG: hypothetical protein Q8881_02900, partial [Sweet potato little leaf phytoplasma]|nr:hypothetical protein [Sweet potato little leaf phytoplasma]
MHSCTFPPKRPNFRRVSHSGRFRQNGRMNPDEFTPNFVVEDVSDETAEFPPNFALGDISPETAEFPPNFAVMDVSDETAESILPNFALGTIMTKRPNFLQISHSGTFPPKWPNQSRRISHSGRFRRNSRSNPAKFPPYFALVDVFDETAELPPNFTLGNVSHAKAEF